MEGQGIEGVILVGSIFVISARIPEAAEPLQGQLEFQAQSREAMVAYVSTAISAPLVPGKVDVKGGVLEAIVAPTWGALPRRR